LKPKLIWKFFLNVLVWEKAVYEWLLRKIFYKYFRSTTYMLFRTFNYHRSNEATITQCIFEFHSSWVCCYYLLSQDFLCYFVESSIITNGVLLMLFICWKLYLISSTTEFSVCIEGFSMLGTKGYVVVDWRFLHMIKFLISDYCLFGSTHEENFLSLHF